MAPLPPKHERKRRDLATEAIVNAAMKLRDKVGHDVTVDFLVEAQVPLEVIDRVLGGGPVRPR